MRGATLGGLIIFKTIGISIHAPHAGSDPWQGGNHPGPCWISIHAPHAGSDGFAATIARDWPNFNPRSPCGERPDEFFPAMVLFVFQSTLPMRGATSLPFQEMQDSYISIHAPHAGSDVLIDKVCSINFISIHAPHAGSDTVPSLVPLRGFLFQSTLPMRGATALRNVLSGLYGISIHAPHAGSDCIITARVSGGRDFNPRSPCGERLAPLVVPSPP